MRPFRDHIRRWHRATWCILLETAYVHYAPSRQQRHLQIGDEPQGLDVQIKAILGRPLGHARFAYVYLDTTYRHGRLGQNMQVVSQLVLGITVGDSGAEAFWRQFVVRI